MNVYLLVECSGRYDDYREKIVGSFTDVIEARDVFNSIQEPFTIERPYCWHEVWEVPIQAEIGEDDVVVHCRDWFPVYPESC